MADRQKYIVQPIYQGLTILYTDTYCVLDKKKKYYNFPTTREMEKKLIFIEYVPIIILPLNFSLFSA